MITDPFDITSSFTNLLTSWTKNSDGLKEMFKKLEEDINSNFLNFLQTNDKSENKFKKDLIKKVRGNSKYARQNFITIYKWIQEFVENVPDTSDKEKERYLFWSKQILNAISPSNFFWTNPTAVQNFLNSEGGSFKNGIDNWFKDYSKDNLISFANEDAFAVGKNLATTKGSIVFKNDIFELIQYESVTKETYKVPIVMIQPWINKYYIFDLTEEMSFVKYLTEKGFTVFITSWRNPDTSLRNLDLEDYIFDGVLKSIEIANDICKTKKCHVTGYCIGGTALTALSGILNNNKIKNPILNITLFASLTDFSSPGDISFFVSKKSIRKIKELMEIKGYLKSSYISQTFRLLKSESLIWPYFANNYLNGSAPPNSDVFYWNSDSTRLPEKMSIFYLNEFYLRNNLIKSNALTFRGLSCDISKINQPVYIVGAEQDHIAPWKETYKICDHISSEPVFILTSEGHIAGFLNPPSPNSRRKYRIIDDNNIDKITKDFNGIDPNIGSWWDHWTDWLIEQKSNKISSKAVGNSKYPVLYDAPGKYVLG